MVKVQIDSLTVEDGKVRWWSRNIANYQPTLRNTPEGKRSHVHRGGRPIVRILFFNSDFTRVQNILEISFQRTKMCLLNTTYI
jgi:hypothetical protein